MTTAAPFDTHEPERPLCRPNRYCDRISLNMFNRVVFGPFPVIQPSSRVNVEGATWTTIFHSAAPGGGTGAYRIGVRLFDIDDATVLRDVFHTAVLTPMAAGVTNVVDLPLTIGVTTQGKIWRLVAVLFDLQNTGGLLTATLNARLWAGRGRRGDE